MRMVFVMSKLASGMKKQALGELVRKNRPSIIFLMESKSNKVKLETTRNKLGFDSSFYVDPEGLSGGLVLWWDSGVTVEVELANKTFIHAIITDKSNQKMWAATFVYGCPNRGGRSQIWEEIKRIGCSEILPWACMGDFNQVLHGMDKLGGACPSQTLISNFHDFLCDCGLVDLEFKGPHFTWRNNCRGDDFIMERIDMVFATAKWREMFDKAMVFVEPAMGFDHIPLILNTEVPLFRVGKPFKFESFWTSEEGCQGVIEDAWSKQVEGSPMYSVCQKLKACKEKLKEWSKRTFGDLRLKIELAMGHLSKIQHNLSKGYKADFLMEEKKILQDLEDLWQKETMYWHQRSRIKWLQLGDRNSRFFHLSTIQRRQKNQIVRLKDGLGTWKENPREIAGIVNDYFGELFKEPPARAFDDLISLIDPLFPTSTTMY
ncbi:hypothetical protein Vadar_008962 [Vaccinium darrowii]|uniref:Uncharacterized protein n=1 Tax=Vaccinium darrowii TaxID=229202 RepID=A0ACB7ZJH3_9ERIC|nr:hypothetical protein Vadar_008962 [Vaccinium darrowii]